MNQRLANRAAVVTGAGTGIGVGIARRLAQEGASVVVSAASSIQGARDLADEIVASGGSALAVQADFRDPTTAIDVVTTAVSNFGGIDVLVNNAGYTLDKPFLETTPDDWSSLFNINVQAMIASSHAAAPHMIERGGGRIINISSVHGPCTPTATSSTAQPRAPSTPSPAPSPWNWPRTRSRPTSSPPAPSTSNATTAIIATSKPSAPPSPTSASATPIDIAGAAAYLASDEARYVTGAVLYIDGGVTSAMAVTD